MLLGSRLWVFALTLVTTTACGEAGGATDGGIDASVDAAGDGGTLVTPPAIPWLREGVPPSLLGPCPEGWREVPGRTPVECDPYPEGGADACGPGEEHFPGEVGCRPIGSPCPSGDYADSLPSTGAVLYVQAGASVGGDGSLTAPYATLSDVPWVALGASTTVALGKGTFRGVMPLKAGVSVVGACAEETIVTGLSAPVPSVVSVTTAGEPAVVENLTIRDAPQRGVQVERGRSLSLRGVLIERVRGIGIFALEEGTEVSVANVVVRDTQSAAVPGDAAFDFGMGIHFEFGARLEAARLVVVANRGFGISAVEEAVVMLSDAVVRDTRPRDEDSFGGRGINVLTGARLDASRILVSGSRFVGIFVGDMGTVLTLTDAVVRDTRPVLVSRPPGYSS